VLYLGGMLVMAWNVIMTTRAPRTDVLAKPAFA